MVTNAPHESAALALKNGCDLNCGDTYAKLLLAHKEGLITEEMIDEAVTRLMVTRMKLGMFDDPSKVPYSSIPFEVCDCDEHRKLALEASKKSLVLLKNRDNILPLDRNKIKYIAVIGPNANSIGVLKGNYYGTASRYITVLEGIREAVNEGTRVYYAEGCHLYKDRVQVLAEPKDRFAEAVSIAERSDVVIMCLGLDPSIEGEEGDTFKEYAIGDKKGLNLPGLQQELLETVHAVGKPVILVLLSGSALAVSWADENIPAIIQAWYPGAEGGRAVASLIFGDFCPSGKLPVTFYRTTEELPNFRDYSMKNRTYRYMQNEALYPFGYGLSYSKFEYGEIKLSSNRINAGDNIECTVTVKNVGNREAEETVQLYLRDVEASVEVPRWQLRGIRKLNLRSDEEKEVSFVLTPKHMSLIDNNGSRILEPGLFEVFIGGSQPDKRSLAITDTPVAKAEFEVTGEAIELEY